MALHTVVMTRRNFAVGSEELAALKFIPVIAGESALIPRPVVGSPQSHAEDSAVKRSPDRPAFE